MPTFVTAIDAEIAELERELADHPAYVKLRYLRQLRKMYADRPAAPEPRTRRHVAPPAARTQSRPMASGTGGAIVAASREYIAGRTTPTPTREIMEMLARKGIEVGGSNPQNVVSSSLSKAPDFTSHGRSGWTLVTPEGPEIEKVDNADPEGSTLSTLFDSRPSQPAPTQPSGPVKPWAGGGT